jgi:hypothetical protein
VHSPKVEPTYDMSALIVNPRDKLRDIRAAGVRASIRIYVHRKISSFMSPFEHSPTPSDESNDSSRCRTTRLPDPRGFGMSSSPRFIADLKLARLKPVLEVSFLARTSTETRFGPTIRC